MNDYMKLTREAREEERSPFPCIFALSAPKYETSARKVPISKTKHTVFPLISAGPQISAAPLSIHIEISAFPE